MQDNQLLTQYARTGSEAAFSQIVARHLALVSRTCHRELGSDALAEDAAQVVFLLLARKARTLRPGPSLAGWLFRTTVFVAKDVRKQEARRTRREEAVMQGTLQTLSTAPTANVLLLSKGISHTMKVIKLKVAAIAATVLVLGGAALPSLTRALSPHNAAVATKSQTKATSGVSSKPKYNQKQNTVGYTANNLAQQLSQLRLRDGFTLVYRVTQRDVRTSAMLASQHQTPSPPSGWVSTISARDGRLLYLTQTHKKMLTRVRDSYVTTWDHTQVVILDGDREYETSGAQDAMINAEGPHDGTPYQDENISRLPFFPLPGTGLPDMDLVQSPALIEKASNGQLRFEGRVPRFNIVGDEPYKSGTIDAIPVQGHLKVLFVRVGLEADPRQTWHYSDHQWFQEHWIGAQMQAATYYKSVSGSSSKKQDVLPSFLTDYKLVSAENKSLAASAFDIKAYLAKGAHVLDTADGVNFDFDPQAGTFKQQASYALSHRKT